MWTRGRDSALGSALAGATYTFVAFVRLKMLPSWAIIAAMLLAALLAGAIGVVASWYFGRRGRKSSAPALPADAGATRAFLRGIALLVLLSSVFFVAMRDVGGRLGVTSDATWRDLVVVPVIGIAAFVLLNVWSAKPERVRAGRALFAVPVLLVLGAIVFSSPAQTRHDADVTVPPPATGRPKRVIVAIDGLGASQFDQYRDRMPNLDAFAKQASRGEIDADPPMLSAAIWTAIATGLPMRQSEISTYELFVDGMPTFRTVAIDKFFEDPSTTLLAFPIFGAWRAGLVSFLPATRFHRRGKPFWEEDLGRVAVICWAATWPAEPIAGVMVSDRWSPEKSQVLFHNRTNLPDQVWPKDFEARIQPLQRRAGEPPDADLIAMADFLPAEVEAFMADQVGEPQHLPRQQPFSNAYFGWLNDRSCFAAARVALDETRPDVLAVYLLGADLTAHALAPGPDGIVPGFDEKDSARLSKVMGNYWARMDRDLGWLLEAGDTTVVLSDHGLEASATNILFGNWHAGHGLVLVRGEGFGPDKPLGTTKPEERRGLLLGRE